MTTIDELGRRAGAAARADAAEMAAARWNPASNGFVSMTGRPLSRLPARSARGGGWPSARLRLWSLPLVVALVVNLNDGESHRLVPGSAPLTADVTAALPNTTLPGTTVASETTPTPPPAESPAATNAIEVRHDDLPPAFPAEPFLGITDQTSVPFVAIGDTRIVLVDADASTVTLIDPFAPSVSPQPVPIDVVPTGLIAAGPGDVLYAVVQGEFAEMSIDAIALSGDRAGQVVASRSVRSVEFAEAPTGMLGHGADGIIDRRTGEPLIGYVDVNGAPVSLGRPAHTIVTAAGGLKIGDLVVSDPDGRHDWHLVVDRDPLWPGPNDGDEPPAPSSHGGAIVRTTVGPPDGVASDFPTPTEPVVAVLAADGTGTWYSLVDGWHVAASDLDGTILARLNGSTVELARLDPPQRLDFLDQPAAPHQRVEFAETLPTTLTTAAPCALADLDIVPTAGGAGGTMYGGLYVRNKSDQPCEVSGVPNVALVGDAGEVVSSNEARLDQSGTDSVVLEPDSWALATLGPIASNVCGGSQSSTLRLTTSGGVVEVPFAVGSPVQPGACDASAYTPPGPEPCRSRHSLRSRQTRSRARSTVSQSRLKRLPAFEREMCCGTTLC